MHGEERMNWTDVLSGVGFGAFVVLLVFLFLYLKKHELPPFSPPKTGTKPEPPAPEPPEEPYTGPRRKHDQ